MAAVSSTTRETPQQTMDRVRSELGAAGTPTGARGQLNVEREAGLQSFRAPAASVPAAQAPASATVPTAAETSPSTTPVTQAGGFVAYVQKKAGENVAARRAELLDAPANYDTQVALQRGALYQALSEDATALTPESLRWLTPDQQAAIRSGDKGLVKNAIVGLNSILSFRENARKEEAAKKDREDAMRSAKAETAFNLYSQHGLWDNLSDADRASMESSLGLPAGTIGALAERQAADSEAGQYDYKYSAGTGNTLVELVTDKGTGKMVSTRVIGGGGGAETQGGGGASRGTVGIARPEGAAGSLSDRALAVWANPSLLKNYTPTEKGKIQDEIASAGLDTSRLSLAEVGAGQRDKIDELDAIMREAGQADQILEAGLNTGIVQTRVKELGQLFGGSPEFTKYNSAISNMSSMLLKSRSGGAVTPQEFERISGFIPRVTDDEKTAKTKMEQFRTELEAAQKNYIIRSTQSSFDLQKSVLGDLDMQSDSTLLQGLDFSL